MGCMPYGRYSGLFYVMIILVSIPHMGCMPYGRIPQIRIHNGEKGFNPSYGLHALRAMPTTPQ